MYYSFIYSLVALALKFDKEIAAVIFIVSFVAAVFPNTASRRISSARLDGAGHLIESDPRLLFVRVTAWIIYARENHVPSLTRPSRRQAAKKPFKTTRGARRLLLVTFSYLRVRWIKNSLIAKILLVPRYRSSITTQLDTTELYCSFVTYVITSDRKLFFKCF